MESSISLAWYETPVVDLLPDQGVIVSSAIAWYVVAVLVLLAIAVTLVAGMILYCMWQGKTFSGQWNYTDPSNSYIAIGCQ